MRGCLSTGARSLVTHSKSKTLHKPKAPHSSYYIYPAIDENEMYIRDTYYDEIERLRKKY